MDISAHLQSIPLFASLTDTQMHILTRYVVMQTYPKGTILFREGDAGDQLFIIVRGNVRIYTTALNGSERGIAIFSAGDFFGELALLDGQPRSATAETTQSSTMLVLPRSAFLESIHSCPPIAATLLEALALRLRRSTSHAGELGMTATQRVIRQLRVLAADDGTVQLTQDELASLSNTTRETVNRVLRHLREAEVVQIARPFIRILDQRALDRMLDIS